MNNLRNSEQRNAPFKVKKKKITYQLISIIFI